MRPLFAAIAPVLPIAPALTVAAAVVARRLGDGPAGATVSSLHLAMAVALYVVAGMRAARVGARGWAGGLLMAGMDALLGHGGAFLLAPPPTDPAAYAAMLGRTPGAAEIPGLQLQAAAGAAAGALVFGAVAGAIGGVIARRRPAAPA